MGNTCTHIGKKNDEINFLNVPNFMKKILKLLRREHKRPKRHIMFFNKTVQSCQNTSFKTPWKHQWRFCKKPDKMMLSSDIQMMKRELTRHHRTNEKGELHRVTTHCRSLTWRKPGKSRDRPRRTEGACDEEDSLNYWTEGGLLRKRWEKAGKPLEHGGESKTLTSFLMQL